MGPCAVRMGPGAGWSRGWVIGGPWRRGAAGAGRRDSGEPAAAAITAATARGLGSRPPAKDLGSSLEKVRVPCRGERGGEREKSFCGPANSTSPRAGQHPLSSPLRSPPLGRILHRPGLTASSPAPLGFL